MASPADFARSDKSAAITSVRIRFAIACPRSGSTLLMRIFAESAVCMVTSRLVLMGNYDKGLGFMPDYSILQQPEAYPAYQTAIDTGKAFVICKEELGHDSHKGECLYNVLPDLESYQLVRPAFLIRDPVRIFDSWKNVGWLDMESFIHCYKKLFQMQRASAISLPVVYERLISSPRTELERLCKWWDVPFSDNMLEFNKPFGSFWFHTDREKSIYSENPLGLFDAVQSYNHVKSDLPSHNLISNHEREHIDNTIGTLYLSYWKEQVDTINKTLLAKSWFGFDLDDTLHEFRKASGAAVMATLLHVATKDSIPIKALQESYSRVLLQKTAQAFTDGKTSDDYRKERFESVLQEFSLPSPAELLDQLAEMYKTSLELSLERKAGAMSLLTHLKSIGKKVMIITEGPQDAQEWTVEKLGLTGLVDYLATTNVFGVSKVDGLFPKVLDRLGIEPSDVVYVGDNVARDVVPAVKCGIYAIHYAEKEHFSLDVAVPKINTLVKLEHILKGCWP